MADAVGLWAAGVDCRFAPSRLCVKLFGSAEKVVVVELAARLAELSGRAIGEHYGIGATGVGAIHRPLAERPGTLAIVEDLAKQLRRRKPK